MSRKGLSGGFEEEEGWAGGEVSRGLLSHLEEGSGGEVAVLVCRHPGRLPNTPQAVTTGEEVSPVCPSDSEAGGRPRMLSQEGAESGSSISPPEKPLHRVHVWDQKSS